MIEITVTGDRAEVTQDVKASEQVFEPFNRGCNSKITQSETLILVSCPIGNKGNGEMSLFYANSFLRKLAEWNGAEFDDNVGIDLEIMSFFNGA